MTDDKVAVLMADDSEVETGSTEPVNALKWLLDEAREMEEEERRKGDLIRELGLFRVRVPRQEEIEAVESVRRAETDFLLVLEELARCGDNSRQANFLVGVLEQRLLAYEKAKVYLAIFGPRPKGARTPWQNQGDESQKPEILRGPPKELVWARPQSKSEAKSAFRLKRQEAVKACRRNVEVMRCVALGSANLLVAYNEGKVSLDVCQEATAILAKLARRSKTATPKGKQSQAVEPVVNDKKSKAQPKKGKSKKGGGKKASATEQKASAGPKARKRGKK